MGSTAWVLGTPLRAAWLAVGFWTSGKGLCAHTWGLFVLT